MTWWNKHRPGVSRVNQRRRPTGRRPLTLEHLEDRVLPSACVVDRLTDTGAGRRSFGDLRYCITRANDMPGPDVVQLAVQGTINLAGALPNLRSDIDIQGPGASQLTVRRNTGGNYRIFTVAPSATVGISGLAVTNGLASASPLGAGVYNAGTLTLDGVVVTANDAEGGSNTASGGGIYNASSGILSLTHSSVTNNYAESVNAGGRGGGIANLGMLTVLESTVASNVAGDFLSGNNHGGGLSNSGTLSVIRSTVSGNSVTTFAAAGVEDGGGILNEGTLTVLDSTVSGNYAEGAKDAGYYWGFGISTSGPAAITNSTIFGNRGPLYVTGFGGGGGIDQYGGTLTVSHTTVTGNSLAAYGGGILVEGGSLVLHNTIVAGNSAKVAGPDLYGPLTESGYNLIGNSSGGTGYDGTDLLNVSPMLGPLQDNGGPTKTIALLPGSPAIDAGDNTNAPDWDQRGPGYPRIVSGTIDIGAFEVQNTNAPGAGPTGLAATAALPEMDRPGWSAEPDTARRVDSAAPRQRDGEVGGDASGQILGAGATPRPRQPAATTPLDRPLRAGSQLADGVAPDVTGWAPFEPDVAAMYP
jgi:hypothetical protein